MELERYVNGLREQLVVAAAAGGEDARALAERLIAALDPAVRLVMFDALSTAAGEITRELAPGSVELRLRGADPEFVVSPPPPARPGEPAESSAGDAWRPGAAAVAAGTGEGGVSRVNLRLPNQLKRQVEEAADRDGLSINAWLVRAAAFAVERADAGARPESDAPRGGRSFTGWGR